MSNSSNQKRDMVSPIKNQWVRQGAQHLMYSWCVWIDLKPWSNYLEKVKNIHYWLTCFCYWTRGVNSECSSNNQAPVYPGGINTRTFSVRKHIFNRKYHHKQTRVKERQWCKKKQFFSNITWWNISIERPRKRRPCEKKEGNNRLTTDKGRLERREWQRREERPPERSLLLLIIYPLKPVWGFNWCCSLILKHT